MTSIAHMYTSNTPAVDTSIGPDMILFKSDIQSRIVNADGLWRVVETDGAIIDVTITDKTITGFDGTFFRTHVIK